MANLIAEFWDLKCTEVGGWLVAKPNSPLVAEEEFLDRGPLERVLSSLISEKHLSLEVASAYAQQAISSQAGLQVEGRMVSAIVANGPTALDSEMISFITYPALRLHSALTNEQKLRGECTVRELTDSARAILTDWLFHSVIRTQTAEIKFSHEQPFRTLALSEITETLPNGLSGDLKIAAKIEETPLIAIKDGDVESVQPPPNVAFLVDPEFAPNVLAEAVKARVLRVTLTLPGGLLVPVNVYESPPAKERKWGKISDLPSDVLDLLRSELRKQNDQFPDFTLPGGGVPPPRIR